MPTSPVTDNVALHDARQTIERAHLTATVGVTTLIGLIAFVGCFATFAFDPSHLGQAVVAAVVAFGLGLPASYGISIHMRGLIRNFNTISDEQQRRIDTTGQRREFDATLADAFEMTDTESEALRVIERTLAAVLPDRPVELLLADNSHAHLTRVAYTAPEGGAPGCGVASPQECPAARRARVHHFPDSQALNACPKLEGRKIGHCSAMCIPVAVMGRTVGVIHAIGEVGESPPPETTADLASVANQAGARLGLLRMMAETQMQATTDPLTGLLNRRAFENKYLRLRDQTQIGVTAAVAMADLDHFKHLNDTYGHDTGDRALRIFAETLRTCLRADDLPCRRGGEEFAVFFPSSDAPAAVSALQRVQTELCAALTASGLPAYTASFGLIEADQDEDLDSMLKRADTALFAAKAAGRDRVIVHDRKGNEVLYPATAFPTSQDEMAISPADVQLAGDAE